MRPLPGSPPLPSLSPEEWADCLASAREMTLVTGRAVSVSEVAAEFVRARESEAAAFRALLVEASRS